MKKRILIFILLIFVSLFLGGCKLEEYTYGDFIYVIHSDSKNGDYISIIGLSEEGRTKEEIYVPEKIDGLEVRQMGYKRYLADVGEIVSEKLRVVYISHPLDILDTDFFIKCPNLEKFIYTPIVHDSDNVRNLFFYNQYIEKNDELMIVRMYYYSSSPSVKQNSDYFMYEANVIFDCNYDNKIHSFDFYNGTTIKDIPSDPVRAGYRFMGWYKEKECINKWDFENDHVPEVTYDKIYVLYDKTFLYAKWEKVKKI